jgi:hypothetical protein
MCDIHVLSVVWAGTPELRELGKSFPEKCELKRVQRYVNDDNLKKN